MRCARAARWGVLLLLFAVSAVSSTNAESPKKLIHLGVGKPDITELPRVVDEMERDTPFDGWVLAVTSDSERGRKRRFDFSWESFSKRAFTKKELQPSLDALKATHFKKLTDNFLLFCTSPADVDWFDSHETILNNCRLAAWLAKEGGMKGIFFDAEAYYNPLFDYHKQKYAKTKSYDEYASQLRKRGAEIMRAFQSEYPGITIFMTFGHTVNYKYGYPEPSNPSNHGENAFHMWTNDPRKLQFFEYGLLSALIDGMVEAADANVKIIDGSEMTYAYYRNQEFRYARQIFRELTKPFMKDEKKFFSVSSQAFGIFMDNRWQFDINGTMHDAPADPKLEYVGWDNKDFARNFWQPVELQTSLTNALKNTDQYVWLYAERSWFYGAEKTVSDEYLKAIRAARLANGME
jgi:hypothetical protein